MFLFNRLHFGSALPTSGMAKTVGLRIGSNVAVLVWYVDRSVFPVALLLAAWLLRWRRGLARGPAFTAALWFLGVHVVCGLYYGLFSEWSVWRWYEWAVALSAVFSISSLIEAASSSGGDSPRARGAWLSVAALVLGITTAASECDSLVPSIEAAYRASHATTLPPLNTFARQNLHLLDTLLSRPGPDVVAMGDRAGSLGYWLRPDQGFIHTEGLVASRAYIDALREGHAVDFLERAGVTVYVVDREAYLEGHDGEGRRIIGVVEPIQSFSDRDAYFVLCFPEDSILDTSRYEWGESPEVRYAFDFGKRVACAPSLVEELARERSRYGGVRMAALPSERGRRSWLAEHLDLPW